MKSVFQFTNLLAFSLSVLAVSLAPQLSTAAPVNCAQVLANAPLDRGDGHAQWIQKSGSARVANSVAVVVHGLNTNPLKMADVENLLGENGVRTLGVTLAGHAGDESRFKQVSRSQWLNDLYLGYCAARREADRQRVPLYFVGFSLGGALGVDLATDPDFAGVRYDRMILIAPAISVHDPSYLVNVLKMAGPGFILPSMSPESYRANVSGTSVAAYSALFDSISHIGQRSLQPLNVPTLVLIDPKDELVSMSGIRSLISRQGLSQWTIKETTSIDAEVSPSYHHLIIDRQSLGARVWPAFASSILASLSDRALPAFPTPQSLCFAATRWKTIENGSCEKDYWPGCDRNQTECVQILRR